MSRDLVTIGPETTIAEAAALMAQKSIRRLPVVEKHPHVTHLLGIISAKDILHAFPPDVNPFAVSGPETALTPVKVSHIMSRQLETAPLDTPIEAAARRMTEKKIGVLPVMHGENLVGLITQSDIFRAFVSFFEPPQHGARITFDVSSGEDVFTFISQAARRRKLRVLSLISSQQDNVPVCVVCIAGPDVDGLLDDLWNSAHCVINVLRFG